MSLLKELSLENKIISIVGMAKNSGKTATLNYLVEEAMDEGMVIGVTSTGRDGEDTDLVTGTDKPRVYLEEGTLVAVPKGLYDLADADLEIMRLTDYHSTIGQIMICKVVDAGYVQIAGPVSTKEQKLLCKDLLDMGVEIVLIDGAIDRRHIANPEASDAVILATGAVLSRDLKKVVKETAHVISLYSCPKLENELVRKSIEELKVLDKILTIDVNNKVKQLDLKTGLGSSNYLDKEITEEVRFIYIPGAFTSSVVGDIKIQKLKNIKFILKDPTKIFIDNASWKQYLKKGMQVEVLENIKVAAVTVNPYSPNGYFFEQKRLKEEMEAVLPNLPILDVRA